MLEKLTALLLDLVVLEADVAETVLALLWSIKEGEDGVLQSSEAVIAVMEVVLLHRLLFGHPNYIYI